MDNRKITEERLRNRLDSNQVERERMCLALLPLLGNYSQEKPRRPKGGPDGSRDIEAMYKGELIVWGAIGFRNGGGADSSARREIQEKYKSDLEHALTENPNLKGFIFFTNVDLTPSIIDSLHEFARTKNVLHTDTFDMERIIHALDSTEGLIVRYQYLDISMSITEQASLFSKYGDQLNNAVAARFDRVERTLGKMERFLDFQKPIFRLDIYLELIQAETSESIGNESLRFDFHGIQSIDAAMTILATNQTNHPMSKSRIVFNSTIWSQQRKPLLLSHSMSQSANTISIFHEIQVGSRTSIANLTKVGITSMCTKELSDKILRIVVDINGYEFFSVPAIGISAQPEIQWPDNYQESFSKLHWVYLQTLSRGTCSLNLQFPRTVLCRYIIFRHVAQSTYLVVIFIPSRKSVVGKFFPVFLLFSISKIQRIINFSRDKPIE